MPERLHVAGCPYCGPTEPTTLRSLTGAEKLAVFSGGVAALIEKPTSVFKFFATDAGPIMVCERCAQKVAICPRCRTVNGYESLYTQCSNCGKQFM